MSDDAAAQWIARRDAGDWCDTDEAQFRAWINASTGNRVAWLRLNSAWEEANRIKALGAGIPPGVVPTPEELWNTPFFKQKKGDAPAAWDEQDAITQGRENTALPRNPRIRHRFIALAASILIAFIATWSLWPRGASYRTEIGGIEAVPIADGSRITLNTNSEIHVALSKTERRIHLDQGEAFFEVAKDPTRPFIVQAGDQRVIAVGTKFSVRRTGDDVQVVVTEGKVRVEQLASLGPKQPIAQLEAGNVARTGPAGVLVQEKKLPEAEEILSWRSGYVVFRQITLQEAAAEFNRYNTRKITIADPAIAAIRIGGNFRSTNVDAFVRLLQDDALIKVEQSDDRILLTAR